MNSSSGGSRLRAPQKTTSAAEIVPRSTSMRSGIPHSLPEGDVAEVLRSPCASSQRRRRARAARPALRPRRRGRTAAAEHERPRREIGCHCERLHRKRLLFDDRDLGIVERERCRLDHGLASIAPRSRHAHEPRAERAAAAMALVAASIATAVSVRHVGHRARSRLIRSSSRKPRRRSRPSCRRARTRGPRRSRSASRRRA